MSRGQLMTAANLCRVAVLYQKYEAKDALKKVRKIAGFDFDLQTFAASLCF